MSEPFFIWLAEFIPLMLAALIGWALFVIVWLAYTSRIR